MNLASLFAKDGIKCAENVDTAKISSIKAGGIAKIALYPSNRSELIKAIGLCNSYGINYKIIGGCTNTYFCDTGFGGAVIFTSGLSRFQIEYGEAAADCGCSLSGMLKSAASDGYGISGALFGIPGSVGGALRNNAGAYGCEISEVFIRGEFLNTENLEIVDFENKDLHFSYRYSDLQKSKMIFLSGRFKIYRECREQCYAEFSEYARNRRETQPLLPSLGSFFKRFGNVIPAKLIDDSGLKGFSVGGAAISGMHAGFIVNRGCATATDIDAVALHTQQVIKEKYGITLVREAELVG